MSTGQLEFGRHLRAERERRGVTLQAIADCTKIPISLLAGLERGDIGDWPCGLFGRAHFRAYAAAVGLSSEPLMADFLHLAGNDTVPPAAVHAVADDGAPRLTLAEDRRWGIRSAGMRVLASALDVCGIFAIATAFARLVGTDLWQACALVGLTYYALATMALGQSVTLWYLGRILQRTTNAPANVRTPVFLAPRRRLHASRRQQNPVGFGENPSAPAAQATLH